MRHYDIKAIPTTYKKTTYRSRLEARWAVFFSTLRIKYSYEPQVFSTRLGGYLPDFYLPKTKWLVEVKPNTPTQEEVIKVQDVSSQSVNIAIVSGEPNITTETKFFVNGKQVFFKPSYWQQISTYWANRPVYVLVNLLNLEKLTGKRNFYKAFKTAKEYDFER